MIFVVLWNEFFIEVKQKSIKKRSRKQTSLCDGFLIDFGMILEVFWEGKTEGSR